MLPRFIRRSLSVFSIALVATLGSVLLVPLAGCKRDDARKGPAPLETYFPIKVGERTVRMQLALIDGERAQGLMFRQSLGADEGMLFLERYPKQQSFWMRNVSFPLDIGFFDASGVLVEVHAMYARDEKQVTSQSKQLKYALEMNLGWFSKNGVKAGAKLDLPAVKQAIDQRGMSAERWGL